MAASESLAIDFDPVVRAGLDRLARRHRINPTELAAVAIADYVALDIEHVAGIEAALREADAGDFASDAEVEAVFSRWSSTRPR